MHITAALPLLRRGPNRDLLPHTVIIMHSQRKIIVHAIGLIVRTFSEKIGSAASVKNWLPVTDYFAYAAAGVSFATAVAILDSSNRRVGDI